jgi:hypothetical protein
MSLSTCCLAKSWHYNHAGGLTHTVRGRAATQALQQWHGLDGWMNFFPNHLLQATSELMKKGVTRLPAVVRYWWHDEVLKIGCGGGGSGGPVVQV